MAACGRLLILQTNRFLIRGYIGSSKRIIFSATPFADAGF
jgi:hypothetical protein